MRVVPISTRGFSFVEVIVSIFIIGVMLTLFQAMLVASHATRNAKDQDLATKIADNELEGLRAGGYAALPASGSFSDNLMTALPSGSGAFTTSNFNAKTKQVVVTVSWKEPEGTATSSVALTTLVTNIGGLP